MSSVRLHPASRLLAWIVFALLLSHLSISVLAVVSLLMAGWYLYARPILLRRYFLRIRVLLLTLLLLYAYATPGEPVMAAWGSYAPSWEGLRAGGLQGWRLLILVATLSVALQNLNRAALLAGIYTLLMPLRILGLPIERMSARLSLTMYYADQLPTTGSLSARWDRALALPDSSAQLVTLSLPRFGLADVLLAGMAVCLIAWVLG